MAAVALALLRALLAVWKRTCPDLAESQVKRVLGALATPPLFHVPPHRVAHTRHWMPWEKKGPADRTPIFDTFVSVRRNENLLIHWPDGNLADDDRTALAKLVGNLAFLGRAEAWVAAELVDATADWNCVPDETVSNPVVLFCPDPATAFGGDYYPARDSRKIAKFLFDCPPWHLCLDTETVHAERWPCVPGTRWVNYLFREAQPISAPTVRREEPRITVARFRLDAPVLPLVTESLPVAEEARRSLLRGCKYLAQRQSPGLPDEAQWPLYPAFWAKSAERQPRKGHGHAFFLPTDEDDDGRLDHLTVVAPMSFNALERGALAGLRNCLRLMAIPFGFYYWEWGLKPRLMLHYLAKHAPGYQRHHLLQHVFQSSVAKNVIGPRIVQRPSISRRVLQQELERFGERGRQLPAIESIEPLEGVGARTLRPIQFKCFRQKATDDGGRRPRGAFRIVFADPITGPICLGHSCHFGMGLFVPENEKEAAMP